MSTTVSIESLKPYATYKDSGVEWLGEVPEHWETHRLKSLVRQINEQTTTKADTDIYIALEHVERWTGRLLELSTGTTFDSQAKRFWAGDVLFGKLRPYLAKVTRPQRNGVCVGEFLVLRAKPALAPEYLEQTLRSAPVIDFVSSSTYGAKMPRAEWAFLGNMLFPLPPLPEQTAIVRFLDYVDRRVRRVIRARRKRIELLEEYKQALIHQAVTGQIDVRTGKPYPAYKDSSVEWLGKVPEHWRVAALRSAYEQCLGKMLDSKRITGTSLVPYLRNADVQWDRIDISDLPEMDIFPGEFDRYTLKPGDLLICEGGEVGRAAIWNGELPRCGFQKALHRLRPRSGSGQVPRYMMYSLRAATLVGAFSDGHVSTIEHLTGEKLRTHRFAFPPATEQAAIVDYLDSKQTRADASIAATRREIELLQEFRTRLVADVVTGKLDVREVAARLSEEPDEPEDAEGEGDDVGGAQDDLSVGAEA